MDAANEPAANASGPVPPRERVELIDVLRGFALFGVLMINWGSNYMSPGAIDKALVFLFESKFYPLLSFLFGLGFAIQIIRAEEKGRPIVARYLWRTFLLFMIGVAHFTLIWNSDIAHRYALMAVPLLLFAKLRPTHLLVASAALLVFSQAPITSADDEGHAWNRMNPELASSRTAKVEARGITTAARIAHARTFGEYAEGVARAANQLWNARLRHVVHFDFWKNNAQFLFLFVLGLWAGRRRILHEPAKHRRLLLWVLGVGWIVGLTGDAASQFPQLMTRMGVAIPDVLVHWDISYTFCGMAMTFGYISAVTLLFTYRERARRVLAPLSSVGRMSLTNYIMQGVILGALTGNSVMFTNGLLDGPMSSGWRMLLLVGVFALQIAYSHWWFRFFQFGPVEWAFRSLTWFHSQPNRVTHRAVLAPAVVM